MPLTKKALDVEKELLKQSHLPLIHHMFDMEEMAQRFEAHFQQLYPEQGLRVEWCKRRKTFFRLNKALRVLYKVRFRDRKNRPFFQWLYCYMYPPGVGRKYLAKAFDRLRLDPHDSLAAHRKRPVSFIEPLDMVVWAFPFDPRLSQLQQLTSPRRMKQLVERHADALGISASEHCKRLHCRPVKYIPGNRCVLRFDLDVVGPNRNQRQIRFYSKTYERIRSQEMHRIFEQIHQQTQQAHQTLIAPKPLINLEDLNTYWQLAIPGHAVAKPFTTPDWALPLPRIAQALAEFHHSAITGLPAESSMQQTLEEAVEDGEKIGGYLPLFQQRAQALADQIQSLAPQLEPAETLVPIHNAFRTQQVFDCDPNIAILDYDSVALGDPLYDVAEFATSMLFRHIKGGVPLEAPLKAMADFGEAYQQHAGWRWNMPRLYWYVAAFCLHKYCSAIKGFNWKVLRKADDVFALVQHFLDEAKRA